ncbi:MAG: rhodanese-like domain-containing protein [Proteobacteria bacterium]|nr:MAG: rhodanese-like domain-containing protein [Pseudomonadota bacterium]
MTEPVYSTISVQDLHELSKNDQSFLLLDVREDDEYAEFHSTLSRSLPLSRLMEGRGFDEIKIPKDQSVYIICRSGRRSASACEILNNHGFQKTVNVEGGMEAWLRAGYPYARI